MSELKDDMVKTVGRGIGTKLVALLALGFLVSCKNKEGFQAEIPPPRQPSAPGRAEVGRTVDRDIEVGDQLEIFVREDESFHRVYQVRENGDIIIPLVGRIPVAGFSVKEAEKRVKAQLEKGQLAKATVIVDRILRDNKADGSGRAGLPAENKILVYITGKVNRPGQHRIAVPEGRPLGVYEALLISGGMGRFGDPGKVHILRAGEDGKRVKVEVDVERIMDGELADMPIGEGDVIVVPEKVFGF